MTYPCRTGTCTATHQRQVPPLPQVGPPGPASGLCWDLWRPCVSGPQQSLESRGTREAAAWSPGLGCSALVGKRMSAWRTRGLANAPRLWKGLTHVGRDGLGGGERITRRGARGAGGGPGSGPVSGTHLGLLFLAQTRDGVIHSFRMIVNYGREEVPALGFEPFPLLFLFFLLMSVMGSAET